MVKRNTPSGQVNRRNSKTLQNIKDLMTDLSQKHSIKVGVLQPEGSQKVPDTDLTQAELAAVHEFGANINHPGGQPYIIKEDGMARFISKDKGEGLPKTKPHQINIPARSFLRVPILGPKGAAEIRKAVEFTISDSIRDLSPKTQVKMMDEMLYRVAETALLQVQNAFYNDTIKPPTKESSKKKRKYNPAANTLIDSGQLQSSISYAIDGKQWGKNG